MREVLVEAGAQVDKRFADRPEVAAQIHATLGETWAWLGNHEARAATSSARCPCSSSSTARPPSGGWRRSATCRVFVDFLVERFGAPARAA